MYDPTLLSDGDANPLVTKHIQTAMACLFDWEVFSSCALIALASFYVFDYVGY